MALKRWNFKRVISDFKRKKRLIPTKIASLAVNHFKDNFIKQGFVDRVKSPWRPRRPETRPGKSILIKSAFLKNSIKKKTANFRRIVVGTYSTEYASVHNQGSDRMPKRQFIGKSFVLRKNVSKLIRFEIRNIFKK